MFGEEGGGGDGAGQSDHVADHGGDGDVEQGDEESGGEEEDEQAADLGDEMGVEAQQAAAAFQDRGRPVRRDIGRAEQVFEYCEHCGSVACVAPAGQTL